MEKCLLGQNSQWRIQLIILIVFVSYAACKECYICSGSFPQRDCELWPDTVKHGPVKQECATRFCTTYIRYRPMKHLLIPLGPNKGHATAAPLRPDDFEVVSISRDCVDRYDAQRDNRCIPDGDGMGATCSTSCLGELCNKGLRRPNMTELYGKSHGPTPPVGPNEFDRWTPPTVRTTTTTRATTTTSKSYVEEEKRSRENDVEVDVRKEDRNMDKDGKRRGGKGGNRVNLRGYPDMEPTAGSSRTEGLVYLVASSLMLVLLH